MMFFYVLLIWISGWVGFIAESRATNDSNIELEGRMTLLLSAMHDENVDNFTYIQRLITEVCGNIHITAEQHYQAGERCRNYTPPKWQTAIRCYREAAHANSPHVDACLRCGEYYENIDNNLDFALDFYKRSLDIAPELQQAHKGLMRLYYSRMLNVNQRIANLERARGHAEQIMDRGEEDEEILDRIVYGLLHLTRNEEEAFIDGLQRKKERLQKRLASLQRSSNKAVFVLGPTGAGKSTLVNLLRGIPLEGKKDKFRRLILDVTDINHKGSHISHSTKTGTHFPIPCCLHDSDHSPIVCWDCPGFGDVGGARYDILHMTALIDVLKLFDQIKILLVFNEKRLEGRSAEIINMINECVSLFDRAQLRNMVSLIITGTTDIDHVLILQDYVADQDNKLTAEARGFLTTFLQHNPPRVWHMPKPTVEGVYHVSIDDFWETIQKSSYVEKPFLNVTLSPESHFFLKRLSDHLNKQISEELKKYNQLILNEMASDIFAGKRSSDGLRQNVSGFLGLVKQIGSPIHRGEDVPSRFNVLHLNHIQRTTIDETLDHIDTLQRLFGAIRNGEGEARSVTFDPMTWREGLELVEQNLNALWGCLQRPTSTKTPRTETFNAPESEGFVREEEKFVTVQSPL